MTDVRTKMVERLDALVARAKAGQRPLGCQLTIDSPELVEAIGSVGFEWVLINNEHTTLQGSRNIANAVRAADLMGMPSFVKLNTWDPILARDAIDAGAAGVHIPFVESAARLREILEECRLPPDGHRGFCVVARAAGFYGSSFPLQARRDFIEFPSRHALFVPIIETVEAVNNLDELVEVPGFPVFGIGPVDLAIKLIEVEPDDERRTARLIASVMAIAKRLRAAGKLVCMPYEGPSATPEFQPFDEINDLPYTGDLYCMYHGMELSQQYHRERFGKANK